MRNLTWKSGEGEELHVKHWLRNEIQRMQAGLTVRGYDKLEGYYDFKKVPLPPICRNQGCVNLSKASPNEDADEHFVGRESTLSFAILRCRIREAMKSPCPSVELGLLAPKVTHTGDLFLVVKR